MNLRNPFRPPQTYDFDLRGPDGKVIMRVRKAEVIAMLMPDGRYENVPVEQVDWNIVMPPRYAWKKEARP